jgi:two-component system sensor histidine kinase/response regulator
VSALLTKPARQSELYDAIADADTIQHASLAPPATLVAEPGLEVLIVDDDAINRAVATALLGKRGFRTAIAHNGREAVEMAAAGDYAAIFMDCQMPELDGYDATRRIRNAEHEHEHERHELIIAMTAHSMRGDREKCLAAGMDDYLSKPIQRDDLDAVLQRWRLSGAQTGEPSGPTSGADADHGATVDAPEAVLDHATIAALRDSLTVEMLQQLNRDFDASLSTRLAVIENAMRSGDQAEVGRTAHLLKGSSLTLGATQLSHICQQLETTSKQQGPIITEQQFTRLAAVATEARHALSEQLA